MTPRLTPSPILIQGRVRVEPFASVMHESPNIVCVVIDVRSRGGIADPFPNEITEAIPGVHLSATEYTFNINDDDSVECYESPESGVGTYVEFTEFAGWRVFSVDTYCRVVLVKEFPMSIQEKAVFVLERAKQLVCDVETWADFANELFDQNEGVIASTFPDPTEREMFIDSKEYTEINEILTSLMKKFGVAGGATLKKSGRFVVRVPKSLHLALEIEARAEGVSLNQLVVAKLAIPMSRKAVAVS